MASTNNLMTYEQLRRIQKKCKETDNLQELPKDFFSQLKLYLKTKERLSSSLDRREYENARYIIEDILDKRTSKVVKLAVLAAQTGIRVQNLLKEEVDFFDDVKEVVVAHRKNLNSLMEVTSEEQIEIEKETEKETEVEPTTESESEAVSESEPETKKDLPTQEKPKKLEKLTKPQNHKNQETSPEPEKAQNYEKLKMLEAVPEFLGIDLKVYGPYKPDEIAEIPQKNAKVLIERGSAIPLKDSEVTLEEYP